MNNTLQNTHLFLILSILLLPACKKEKKLPEKPSTLLYTMPAENETHEGTWLQWPHQYQYGMAYRNSLDSTWIAMTKALVSSENVHIIAYNQSEKDRIISLLAANNISLNNIDFNIFKTDDVWIRDNGPVYVKDSNANWAIEDWGFNGWGHKTDYLSGQYIEYANCNLIPFKIANIQGKTYIDLNTSMINEGGAVEVDGQGTLMACKSSILNNNRNPGMTQAEAEAIFTKYLGVSHFIWLDGRAGLEITDQHIDGFARFANDSTIVTMNENDLLEYEIKQSDIDKLYAAKNKQGNDYLFLKIPLTKNTVTTTDGKDLGYKGSYVNFYIANNTVLVPNYKDSNDSIANALIQTLFPARTVVGIDVRNLYENGGMVHCVTQQQAAE